MDIANAYVSLDIVVINVRIQILVQLVQMEFNASMEE